MSISSFVKSSVFLTKCINIIVLYLERRVQLIRLGLVVNVFILSFYTKTAIKLIKYTHPSNFMLFIDP